MLTLAHSRRGIALSRCHGFGTLYVGLERITCRRVGSDHHQHHHHHHHHHQFSFVSSFSALVFCCVL